MRWSSPLVIGKYYLWSDEKSMNSLKNPMLPIGTQTVRSNLTGGSTAHSLQIPIRTFALYDKQDVHRTRVDFKNGAVIANTVSVRVISDKSFCEREGIRLSGVKINLVGNTFLYCRREVLKMVERIFLILYAHTLFRYPKATIHFFCGNASAGPRLSKVTRNNIYFNNIFHIGSRREIQDSAQCKTLRFGLFLRRSLQFLVNVENDFRVHMHPVYTAYIQRQASPLLI